MGAACGVGWGVADGIAEGVAAGTAGDAGTVCSGAGVAAGRFMRPASTGVGRGGSVLLGHLRLSADGGGILTPEPLRLGKEPAEQKIARNSNGGDAEEQDYVEALALQKVAHSFQEWFFHAV